MVAHTGLEPEKPAPEKDAISGSNRASGIGVRKRSRCRARSRSASLHRVQRARRWLGFSQIDRTFRRSDPSRDILVVYRLPIFFLTIFDK